MSKTIEVASSNAGKIGWCDKQDKQRTTVFEPKEIAGRIIGLATLDHEEAEHFLGIGLPHFWKPGQEAAVTVNANPAEALDAEIIAQIQKIDTIAELCKFRVPGRGAAVEDAINKRGTEIQAALDEKERLEKEAAEKARLEKEAAEKARLAQEGGQTSENTGGNGDPNGDENPPAVFTKEAYAELRDANALKRAIANCTDKGLLMELVSEETQNKNRDTWTNALNARIAEL